MFALTKKIPVLLLLIASILSGCSTADQSMSAPNPWAFTVNQSLLLDEPPEAGRPGKLRVSSIVVTAPKAGDVVFSYADRMPTYYISGAKVSGGAKRADVIYKLETSTEKLVTKALLRIFIIDSTSPYTASGKLDFEFTEVPKDSARAGSQDVDVSILLTLNLKVKKNSVDVFENSYKAQRDDTNKPGLISSTFPTNRFLNTLFRGALDEAVSSADAEKALTLAFER